MSPHFTSFSFPLGILAIAFLLLMVFVILQCAKAEKKTEIQNGEYQKHDSTECIANKVAIDVDDKMQTEENTTGREHRSSTKGSTNLDCANEYPTAENTETTRNQDGPNEAQKNVINAKEQHVIDANAKEKIETSNGSGENSGESIYTRVNSVAKREDCAYSVVEIAGKDTEYELVDGKLQRLEKCHEEKDLHSVEVYDYEMVSPSAAPKLDPVIFAVENSGSSGIYEDVGESKMKIAEAKENERSSSIESQPEQKTKKWGLTRFSLKNRTKTKNDHAKESTKNSSNQKSGKESSANARAHRARASLPDVADLNGCIDEVKTRQLITKENDSSNTPPPPPLESLKLKVDHRRTIHGTESISEQSGILPQRTSVPVGAANTADISAPHWPVTIPNVYTHVDNQCQEDAYSELYEEPDQDVVRNAVHSHDETDGKELSRQKEIMKSDKAHLKADQDYETITCSLDVADDVQSKIPDVQDTEHGQLSNTGTDATYAEVMKPLSKKTRGDSLNTEHGDVGKQKSHAEKKIDVFITKTKISSHLSGEEVPAAEAKSDSNIVLSVDNEKESRDISDLYAKVDMAKKREDQRKKALYASVNKVKTGVCKYYDEDGNDIAEIQPQEYEDGHYTRIKDLNSTNEYELIEDGNSAVRSAQVSLAEKEENEYEMLTEEKNVAMFAAIRDVKQPRRNNAKIPNSEYETTSDLKL